MSIVKLDWQQLSSEDFQSLVSELLQGVLGVMRYKPGPLRGPDGGWDGRFEGPLPFDDARVLPAGVWMIDAKHYQPRRKSAFEQLSDELRVAKSGTRVGKSPIEKAIKAGADYLLIVTSAELRGDLADALERRADGTELEALKVVGRLTLEALVRGRPWLLAQYFHIGLASLVPLRDWSPRIPERRALTFRPRPKEQDALLDALTTATGPKVLLVHAPGGSGKSRFVSELEGNVGREVLALQLNGDGEAAASTLHGLSWIETRGRYAVVIDDADRDFDHRVAPIATLIRTQKLDVVLVLTARTGPHEDLRHRLATRADIGEIETLPLPQLLPAERLEMLRSAIAPRTYESEALEGVVKACGPNLVLLAHAASQLNAGRAPFALIEQNAIAREVADKLLAQAHGSLPQADPDRVRDLLAMLAALGDLWPEDIEKIREIVARGRSDIAPRDVDRWIDALEQVGILARTGRAVTFSSDVEAELLLAELAKAGTRFFDPLIEAFGYHPRLLANIVMLASSRSPAPGLDMCRELLRRQRGRLAGEDSEWRRAKLLRSIGVLAQALPSQALDLATDAVARSEATEPWVRQELVDAVGVVMTHALLALDADATTVARCFELAVDPSLGETRANRDATLSALRGTFNPYAHSMDVPTRTVDALASWLESRGSYSRRERTVIVALLTHLLAPTINYFGSSPFRPEIRHYTRALPATGAWGELNDRGWDLWRDSILTHADATLRAELLAGMARTGLDTGVMKSDLSRRNIERRLELLVQLESAVTTERSLEALAAIQKAALWHWLRLEDTRPDQGGVLSEPARRVLVKIPRSLELDLYTCLWTPSSALDDLDWLTSLPAKERRGYGFGDDRHIVTTHQRVAAAALARATTPDELVDLLRAVGRDDVPFDGRVPPVIVFLLRDGYRLVDAILRAPIRRDSVPPAIVAILERVWIERATDGLARLVERVGDLRRCSPQDARQVAHAALVEAHRGNAGEALAVLREVAAHADPDVRAQLEKTIRYAEVLTPDARMELLGELVRGEAGQPVLKTLAWSLEHSPELVAGADRRPIREGLLATSGERPELVDGLFVRLLAWSCGGDATAFLDAVDVLVASAAPEASLSFYLAEEVLSDFEVDEGELENLLVKAGQLPTNIARELRRSLLSSFNAASDARLDRLLEAEPLDVEASCEILAARRSRARFDAQAPRWITLLQRAQRELTTDVQQELVKEFVAASFVENRTSRGDELPPTFVERNALLAELERGLGSDDGLPRQALKHALHDLDRELADWRRRAAERQAGLYRRP